MNLTDVANLRLINQQITEPKFKTVKDLVGWMGAMQAQDYAMVKWAVGIRLPNSTNQEIETAINRGEIIRTHLLRPTWHLVSAEDVYWLLELTAPHIRTSLKSRQKELELSEAVFSKSNAIIEKALSGGKHLIREELIAELGKAKIATNENRASHLLFQAELDGIVCSGAIKGGKQTYALLEEWVPKPKSLAKEAALARLAKRYFSSHGPATLRDFIWWSGLPVSAAKQALEMVKPSFISETVAEQTYWLSNSSARSDQESVLLPAFDEFIISYTDRQASLPSKNHHKAVSDNGIFRPVITLNGQVIGIWKRTFKKDKVLLDMEFFEPPSKTILGLIEAASIQFGNFLEKKAEINPAF